MPALTPGEDRYQVRALLKMSRTSVVTHLVEAGSGQERTGHCLLLPSGSEEVVLLEGILRETTVLKGIQHPTLPRFDRVVEGEGGSWILLSYEPGTILSQYLGNELSLPEPWVLWWLRHMLLALKALHGSTPPWYLGRIEPSDIVVRGDRLFLVDLALFERIFPERAALSKYLFENFMAPEKRMSAQVSAATDLFAVGALAFWLLTGRAPVIQGPGSAQAMRTALLTYRPTLAPAVADLVGQLLEFYPSQRPDNADSALQRLAPFVTTMTGQVPPAPRQEADHKFAADPTRMIPEPPAIVVDETPRVEPPPPPPARRLGWGWPAGLAAAAVLLVVAVRPGHRPGVPIVTLPKGETKMVVGDARQPRFEWGHDCTVTFGPNSQISPPTWDGMRYTVSLFRGSMVARTGGEAGLDVNLVADNVLHIEPGSEVRLDLSSCIVHCQQGHASLASRSQVRTLSAGGQATLVGGHTH